MANKFDAIVDAIETALKALVTAGTLRQVVRRKLLTDTEPMLPAVGILASRLRREGGPAGSRNWTGEIVLGLLAASARSSAEQNVTDVLAAVDGALETLEDAGTAGGVLDSPEWEFNYDVRQATPGVPIGATGRLKVTIEGPLLLDEEPEEE